MKNYASAGKGLWKLFISYVGVLVCQIVSIIPVIDLIAAVGSVAFTVVGLIGLFQAGKDILGCKIAFILEIVQLALVAICGVNTYVLFFGNAEGIASWEAMTLYTVIKYSAFISLVLSLVIVLVVILSATAALENNGNLGLAKRGYLMAVLVLVLEAVSFVIRLVNEIGGYTAAGYTVTSFLVVSLLAGIILPLVSFILQIDFVSRSADSFGHIS